jgi:hypothetical protein
MRLGLCCLWRRGGRSVRQRTERAAPLPYSVSQLHSKSGGVIDQTLANRLLAALPRVERQSLLAHCEYVELTAPLPLQEAQGRLRHAYFPVDSTISVLAPADRRRSLEIGAVGSEGLFGPESRMEMESFELKGLIQGSGHAWRVDAATLQHLATSHEGLNAILLKYLHVVLVQTARSVACCRFHSLEQRLARWLLTHRPAGHARPAGRDAGRQACGRDGGGRTAGATWVDQRRPRPHRGERPRAADGGGLQLLPAGPANL